MLWNRQRDADGTLEPNLWFDRFVDYLLMGVDRSLLKAVNRWRATKGYKRQNATPGAWSRNAKRWRWRERAQAWDGEQRRQRMEAEAVARAEMIERHIALGQQMQEIGATALAALDPATLNAGDVHRLIKVGIAIERQARGLPDHLLEIAQMSDADLIREYGALVASITGDDNDQL